MPDQQSKGYHICFTKKDRKALAGVPVPAFLIAPMGRVATLNLHFKASLSFSMQIIAHLFSRVKDFLVAQILFERLFAYSQKRYDGILFELIVSDNGKLHD